MHIYKYKCPTCGVESGDFSIEAKARAAKEYHIKWCYRPPDKGIELVLTDPFSLNLMKPHTPGVEQTVDEEITITYI